MSNIEAIGDTPVDSVSFETMEREDHKSKQGLAAEAAILKQFNELDNALTETIHRLEDVAAAETLKQEASHAVKKASAFGPPPQGGTNSMITTFKIMKIVMETLREANENGKEMNKLLKKEWKQVVDKQSANHEESYGAFKGMTGNQSLTMMATALGFSHLILGALVNFGANKELGNALQPLVNHLGAGKIKESLEAVCNGLKDTNISTAWVEEVKKLAPTLSSGGNQLVQGSVSAEQYKLNIKESLFQHEVQTHTSEYQNGSQQQTSDNQSVDNASDTAKQLIRVQGEILMGKAG